MIITTAYHSKDQHLAQGLIDWIFELEPEFACSFLEARDSLAQEINWPAQATVEKIIYPNDGINKWPFSANRLFALCMAHMQYLHPEECWLWLEPDCVPMRAGWAAELEDEYKRWRTCHYMGARVEVQNVPLHMSGVAIYPAIFPGDGAQAKLATDTAWDVFAADFIVPQAHFTDKIVHAWDSATAKNTERRQFNNIGELNNLRGQHPQMVLFHADKSGSAIELLREERRTESRGKTSSLTTTEGGASAVTVAPLPCVCDIFVKTWEPDYPWLEYCLLSIGKFASGFRQIIVISDESGPGIESLIGPKELPHAGIRFQAVGSQPDGYLWQQVLKLDADKYTDASHILYIDSDTIFTMPVTPETYLQDGKILWMMTPYDKTSTPWQPIIEKFMKRSVAFEFMRRAPQMVPRWLLSEMRAFCEREHKMTLDAYILAQPHRSFSEFNALGAFAHTFFRDEFIWINTEEVDPGAWPLLTVRQSWSRGGLTPEIKSEYQAILGGVTAKNGSSGDDGSEVASPATFPAPVLAEPQLAPCSSRQVNPATSGEARESTYCDASRRSDPKAKHDSRGGETFSSISEEIRFHCDALAAITAKAFSRRKMILQELRARELAPKPKKRSKK